MLVVGILYWWFYICKGQDMKIKFDWCDLMWNNGVFIFNNQVYDNIFWMFGSVMIVVIVY